MPTPQTQEALYQALKTMVQATIEHSKELAKDLGEFPRISWVKEYRIVKFGVGRRMGHSTMAMRLCREMAPDRSLFLAHNLEQVRQIQDFSNRVLVKSNPKFVAYNWREYTHSQPLEMVVIDCASFISDATLDHVILTLAAHKHDPIYVLMQ